MGETNKGDLGREPEPRDLAGQLSGLSSEQLSSRARRETLARMIVGHAGMPDQPERWTPEEIERYGWEIETALKMLSDADRAYILARAEELKNDPDFE